MLKDTFIRLKSLDTSEYEKALLKKTREDHFEHHYFHAVIYSAILFWMQENELSDLDRTYSHVLDLDIDHDVKLRLLNTIDVLDDDFLSLYQAFPTEEILAYILFGQNQIFTKQHAYKTPISLIKLIYGIFEQSNGQSLLDFNLALGDFLIWSKSQDKKFDLHGFQEIKAYDFVSKLKLHFANIKPTITYPDIFDEEQDNQRFDYVFANFLLPYDQDNENYRKRQRELKNINKNISSDWIYNQAVLNHTSYNGKACVIISNAAIWNDADAHLRRLMLRDGLVEAVISLPTKLIAGNNTEISLVILSYDNRKVQMIDASELYLPSRRVNSLSDLHIEKIINSLDKDTVISRSVDYEDIKYPYNLSPKKYIGPTIKNSLKLADVVLDIRRGATISSSELDQMISNQHTNYQHLQINQIENGLISYDELAYIEPKGDYLNRFVLAKNKLVLTKNGKPFKSAVYDKDEKNIVVSGNMYIITLDLDKYNPYFLQAYLESDKGQEEILQLAKGTAISNISIKNLLKLPIPNLSLDKQNKHAKLIIDNNEKIKNLKAKLKQELDEKLELAKQTDRLS